MSASQYLIQVQIDYLAYYGRFADPAGQVFWAGKINAAGGNNTAVINAFANSDESLARFGPITSANIGTVVDQFYLQNFNRLPDPAGKAFYVDGFNNGTFTAATIALNIFNGATGADSIALGNKIAVANTASQMIAGHTYGDPLYGTPPFTTTYAGNTDVTNARDFMADVHSDPASVPSDAQITSFLQTAIANPGDPILNTGMTFVLTAGLDVPPAYQGGPANDTFFGSGTTLGAGDDLQGGGGSNTFNYQSGDPFAGGPVSHSGFTVGSIQNFNLTSDVAVTMDMSGTSGVVVVRDTNSRNNLTLTNGPAIVNLEMVNTTVAHDLTVAYQASTVAGGSDTQNLRLDTVLAGSRVIVNGIETIHATTANSASSLNSIISNALKAFNLDGGQSLTLTNLNFPGSGSLTSSNTGNLSINHLNFGGAGAITASNTGNLVLSDVNFGAGNSTLNASGLGGAMIVTLSNAAAGGVNVAVTGSAHNDTLDVQAGFNSGDTFNAGGGTDTMVANGSLTAATNSPIKNLETLTYASGTLSFFNGDWFDTALSTINVNTGTGNGGMPNLVRFRNLEADGSERIVVDNSAGGGNNLDGKEVVFESQVSPVGGTNTVNFQINNVDDPTSVTFADSGFNGGSPDPVGTLNLTANGSGSLNAFFDGSSMGALTTLGLSGSADFDLTSSAATVTTVNGATTTGDVTINGGVLSNSGATVTLGSGNDHVEGGSGNDNIDIGSGGGSVNGHGGSDTITASGEGSVTFNGGEGNDTLTGGDDADKLIGGNGADVINGGDGNDVLLSGDGGNDIIDGGDGNDLLVGGTGIDTLTGGTGEDTFRYESVTDSQGTFIDKITDFVSGTDFIDLLPAMQAAGTGVVDYNDMRFVGNAAGVAAAQSALSGTGGVEIVYDTLNHQVYVDVNGDGLIDGTHDMVIDMDPPATMQDSDFGIVSGTHFTAAVGPFNTGNAADSFENTTTSNDNDIVSAQGSQLAGSTVHGLGGFNILYVTTPITAAIDLGTVMDANFDRLNLMGGTTAPVIGPHQSRPLVVNIGNLGGNFTTGSNFLFGQQNVLSGSGDDTITLTNSDDNAETRGGDDTVRIFNGFDGTVDTGTGADVVDVAAGAVLDFDAVLRGGGDSTSDRILAHDGANLSHADEISGFDHIVLDNNGSVTIQLGDYNGLTGSNKIIAPGNNTVHLIGGGAATLDSTVENWTGDANPQQLTLGSNTQNVSTDGGSDTIISNFASLTGTYNGGSGTDTLVQNVNANYNTGPAAVFISIQNLVLNNGADITGMTDGQHNQFTTITGNDGPFPGFDPNAITIDDVFTGTTRNTIETYNLNGNGATTYHVGGNNQTVNDNNGSGHTVIINGGHSNVTLNTSFGNDTVFATSGGTNLTINTSAGDDTVTANGVNGLTINGGINAETTNLTDITGLSLSYGNSSVDDTVTLNGTVAGSITESHGFGANEHYFVNSGTYDQLTTNYGAGDTVQFQSGGTFTLSNTLYNQFTSVGANVTAAGIQNVTISTNDANVTAFTRDTATAGNVIENYTLASGNDSFTIVLDSNDTTNYSLDIASGGSDKITINNEDSQAGKIDELVVTGFNVANDQLRLINDVGTSGTFQEITAADSALTIGPAGVVEINTSVGALIGSGGALDVSAGGSVESLIAGAIGSTVVTGDDFFVVAYASDGAAYIYEVNLTTVDGNLDTGDFNVELIGQLNGVAANTLGLSNFFA